LQDSADHSRSPWYPGSNILKSAWKLSTLPFLLFILLPVIALPLKLTPLDLWDALQQEAVRESLRVSLVTTCATVAVTLLAGTPVAYYLAHERYRFHTLVDTLVDLPTVLPPAVSGIALLMAFGSQGLLGGSLQLLGIRIPFTQAAVVMAQTFIAAPLYIKAAAIGFSSIDCELKKAAALDGASRWQTFRFVEAPMSWKSILGGVVLTWSRALGEFGATLLFAGNFLGRTQTMPLAIYLGFEVDLQAATTLAVILVIFSFASLLLLKQVLHPRETV
jgi:molybdate transport system permease protein